MTTTLTEKNLQQAVTAMARHLGWRCYHTYDSRRSTAGFPDEVWVRERVIFAELKTDHGKPTPAQREWLAGLLAAGAEAYLIRPADLQALARVLQARSRPTGCDLETRTRQQLGPDNSHQRMHTGHARMKEGAPDA